jgi:transketolase
MRRQLVKTIESMMAADERLVLLLGDIGVFGFRNAFARFPGRVYNIGILEQATIGLAAGLAAEGFIPVFHSIAPFTVERAYEQIKIDFGYQKLNGVIISVGASYDYAALGCTHQCPGDVAILKAIPGMRIVVPGCAGEFDALFGQAYCGDGPIYFRLAEQAHSMSIPVKFGQSTVVQEGKLGTVVVVGPLLEKVIKASRDMDLTVIYYTTLEPFDRNTLYENSKADRIAIVEPFYEGTLCHEVVSAFGASRSIRILPIGVPREFRRSYGTVDQQDAECGLTIESLEDRFERFFEAS